MTILKLTAFISIYLGLGLISCKAEDSTSNSNSDVASITFKTPAIDFDTTILQYYQSPGDNLREMRFENANQNSISNTFAIPPGKYYLNVILKKGENIIANTIVNNRICPNIYTQLNSGNNNVEVKLCRAENPTQTVLMPSAIPPQNNLVISADASLIIDTKICDSQGNCIGASEVDYNSTPGNSVNSNINATKNILTQIPSYTAVYLEISNINHAKYSQPISNEKTPQILNSLILGTGQYKFDLIIKRLETIVARTYANNSKCPPITTDITTVPKDIKFTLCIDDAAPKDEYVVVPAKPAGLTLQTYKRTQSDLNGTPILFTIEVVK